MQAYYCTSHADTCKSSSHPQLPPTHPPTPWPTAADLQQAMHELHAPAQTKVMQLNLFEGLLDAIQDPAGCDERSSQGAASPPPGDASSPQCPHGAALATVQGTAAWQVRQALTLILHNQAGLPAAWRSVAASGVAPRSQEERKSPEHSCTMPLFIAKPHMLISSPSLRPPTHPSPLTPPCCATPPPNHHCCRLGPCMTWRSAWRLGR